MSAPSMPTPGEPGGSLVLEAAVVESLRRHAALAYPDECCGALLGRDGVAQDACALPNTTGDGARRRFLVRPVDYRAAEATAAAAGRDLLGFYHSHPDHPARPSQYDLDQAWPNFVYVIVSVREGRPGEMRAWRLRENRSGFEELALVAGGGASDPRGETRHMSNKILIPTPLRPYAGRQDAVEAEGRTVGELLQNLTTQYADLRKHLYTEDGRLRSFVNVYVNDDDIRYLDREETVLRPGDTVSIIPSVAGGAGSSVESEPAALPALSHEEVRRYSRHLIMPEVGMEGQRKLKAARVLCIGAGGLGSPAALYLTAAGVGTIGIVDFDTVDFSNLQRQIIHGTPDVGRPKLASARDRLQALNPGVRVETHETALSSTNALELLGSYDVVVDGTDNFPTRYLVNDACVLLGKPNVYGSIFRFEGQASVFAMREGPCYRCLYPEPPPPGLVPSCAEGGVLGVLPGIIGTIQATEAIKLIIGSGEPLIGRFLIFDALRMRFRELKLRKDPDCPVCGPHPTVRALIDYDQFCGVTAARGAEVDGADEAEIGVEAVKRRLDEGADLFIVDVREPQEYEICRIPGATLIPLGDLPKRLHELDSTRDMVVHCKSGVRSAKAVSLLRAAGFSRARNLRGGILAWIDKVDPTQPKY